MPFGLNSSPEVFQRRMHEFAERLKGVEVIADDFLVYGCGTNVAEAHYDHDKNLIEMLEKAREVNLRMNPDKLRFKMKEARFIGHILTSEGIKVDPAKVEAINKMPVPEDPAAVKRYLGMVQYLSKFLSKLADMSKPMRKLTEDDREWNWTKDCQRAFDEIKNLISNAPVLAYYDIKKEVTIQCDASQDGIGGVLLQGGKPVFFTSRAMTKTEERYAQIEKEMLAILHCCIKLDQFIYGRNMITIETDHKPLVSIFKKPISDSPKRLQRMLLHLQKYSLQVTYKKGTELYIADTLSRAYLKQPGKDQAGDEVLTVEEAKLMKEIEEISMLTDVTNSQRRFEEIREATKEDKILTRLMEVIRKGWPENKKTTEPDLKPYFDVRMELTTGEGLIFKGDRIVIPKSERIKVMKNLHISHLGIEGTLAKAREYVYWPRMNDQIKEMISMCETCNQIRSQQQKEPLMRHEVPNRAWCTVSADIFEFNKHQYLLIVDHYSNFFEYDALSSISSSVVIGKIKQQFSRYGIPEKLITDNGTQFVSDEFRKFSIQYGFDHLTSSPRHPQSNGKVERAVGVCKRLMEKSILGNTDFYLALLDFRNTPQAEIGLSPSQRMYGRKTRTIIPAVKKQYEPQPLPDVQKKILRSRENQKRHFDVGSKELPELRVGDTIRMRLPSEKNWSKGTVLELKGNRSYLVRVNSKIYRRNRRQLLKTAEIYDDEQEPLESEDPINNNDPEGLPLEEPVVAEGIRRSNRVRRAPDRYSP